MRCEIGDALSHVTGNWKCKKRVVQLTLLQNGLKFRVELARAKVDFSRLRPVKIIK